MQSWGAAIRVHQSFLLVVHASIGMTLACLDTVNSNGGHTDLILDADKEVQG